MKKVEKVKVFAELYELVNYYYENRDLPVDGDFDFSKKAEECCKILDLDFNEFLNEFNFKKDLL
jgi:hypothetical protein